MRLEVISRSPKEKKHAVPILFVHGAWHTAWCWQDTFLKYFSEKGWEVHALSLRGHGQSEGREKLRWWSIADYIFDVEQIANSLDREPIVVGHSLGGLVVQKYLETHSAVGAMLLASVPPSGTLRFNLRVIRRHPLIWLLMNALMTTYLVVAKPEYAREWLFSSGISDEELMIHHSRLQNESYRALLDALLLNLPNPSKVKTPVQVLGAENDAIFSVEEVQTTARAYGVEAIIFPGMAHNMFVEPGWRDVADTIMRWAESLSGT